MSDRYITDHDHDWVDYGKPGYVHCRLCWTMRPVEGPGKP